MNPWILGICMLILFATLNHAGRVALEILLSLAFTVVFFLTLLRELDQKKSDGNDEVEVDLAESLTHEALDDEEDEDSTGVPEAA